MKPRPLLTLPLDASFRCHGSPFDFAAHAFVFFFEFGDPKDPLGPLFGGLETLREFLDRGLVAMETRN